MAPRRYTSSGQNQPVIVDRQHQHQHQHQQQNCDVRTTDTVIVGNGPSALFLSYLLHGNIPTYDTSVHGPHPDPVLHSKLSQLGPDRSLYDALETPRSIEALTEHFPDSAYMSYSNQALPINVLLDTLIQPNADTEIGEARSRIKWERNSSRRVDHLVLGDAGKAGGQWAEDPIGANRDCETLSYAEMLSLPGYSFREHYKRTHRRPMPDLIRPTRREAASYYSAYPKAVGISSEVFTSVHAQRISQRPGGGFTLRVHRRGSNSNNKQHHDVHMTIHCTHLVLATGIYSNVIPPPPIYQSLMSLTTPSPYAASNPPMLVVGSGFTAADVMMAAKKAGRKVIHIYKWNTSRPSPLKGCHPTAYPEYAEIYRRMKSSVAATTSPRSNQVTDGEYEGFPNAQVINTHPDGRIRILTIDGEIVERVIDEFKYCVGRRGSLEYLSPELRKAVGVVDAGWISGDTMRWRVEEDLEIVKGVFVVGSLTGDSLVRFGFGGCAYAAGKISSDVKRGDEARGIKRKDEEGFENGVRTADNRRSKGACIIV
ncbi:hypothetical protein P167DRAFT_573079 [Morchella conica CCBAS932]|uniref:FAD/NAD(P)-binding domain-containing protein n=1 Tax=Morchella conica CCBAS932 TaxID=1392247 RepID=A0A3N4KTE0_9PEZI|nr:hypothetical protein P167DRAFT_573079 [Morchella conica CCBAS932]